MMVEERLLPRWIFDRDGEIDPERKVIADCILGKSSEIGVTVKFRGHSETEKKVGKHCKNLHCYDLEILTKDWIEEGNRGEVIDYMGITSRDYYLRGTWDGESTKIMSNGLYWNGRIGEWSCQECWMGESGIFYDCDDKGVFKPGIPSSAPTSLEEQERLLSGFVPSESPFPTCNECGDSYDVTDSETEPWDRDYYYWCSHCEHDIDGSGDCMTSDCETCDDDDDIDEDTGIQYKFRWDDK